VVIIEQKHLYLANEAPPGKWLSIRPCYKGTLCTMVVDDEEVNMVDVNEVQRIMFRALADIEALSRDYMHATTARSVREPQICLIVSKSKWSRHGRTF
jgi:hypothetical protein